MLDYKVLLILRSRYMVGHGLFMQMYACTFWPFQHKNKEYNKKFTFSLLFGHFPFIIILSGFDGGSLVNMLYHASTVAGFNLQIVLFFWNPQTMPFSIVVSINGVISFALQALWSNWGGWVSP